MIAAVDEQLHEHPQIDGANGHYEQPVVIVDGVSKSYIQRKHMFKLRNTVMNRLSGLSGNHVEQTAPFWALRDISFTISRGESVGLVGRNGAGKSTLLRVICGISQPTRGRVHVQGNFMPLLAVAAGFNTELTGRQNISLIATIQGVPRAKINHIFDDVIEFSELDDFIDKPVKLYSSGMRARLGFSIAINVMPDIIFVDEALAVGDAGFREKCVERILQRQAAGGTLLFTSHSLGLVARVCSRTIWLDRGRIVMDDRTPAVLPKLRDHMNVGQEAD